MSGNTPGLTPKQSAILEKFRENVKDVVTKEQYNDDHYLLRWLRAREFDAKTSEKMIRNSVKWRKQIGADDIKDFVIPEVIEKYYTGGLAGYDKEGSPLWIDPFGLIDLKGICYSTRKIDVMKSKVKVFESIYRHFEEQTKKLGKMVDQVAVIFDLEHLSWKHMWKPGVELFNDLVQMVEDNYPETLKVNYIINAPKYFPIAFNLVKPFLTETTIKKIKVFGTSGWKEVLLREIDEDQLPVKYGGKKRDPDGDGTCRSSVCYGGKVPESYYLPDKFTLPKKSIVDTTIGRGGNLELEFNIKEPGSALRWQFKTQDHDISFMVMYKRGRELELLMPEHRSNSFLYVEEGYQECKEAGKYIAKFDNSYSWMKSKKIQYAIIVLSPNEFTEHLQSIGVRPTRKISQQKDADCVSQKSEYFDAISDDPREQRPMSEYSRPASEYHTPERDNPRLAKTDNKQVRQGSDYKQNKSIDNRQGSTEYSKHSNDYNKYDAGYRRHDAEYKRRDAEYSRHDYEYDSGYNRYDTDYYEDDPSRIKRDPHRIRHKSDYDSDYYRNEAEYTRSDPEFQRSDSRHSDRKSRSSRKHDKEYRETDYDDRYRSDHRHKTHSSKYDDYADDANKSDYKHGSREKQVANYRHGSEERYSDYRYGSDYTREQDYRDDPEYQYRSDYRHGYSERDDSDYRHGSNYGRESEYRREADHTQRRYDGYSRDSDYHYRSDEKHRLDYKHGSDYKSEADYRYESDYRRSPRSDYRSESDYRHRHDYGPSDMSDEEYYRRQSDAPTPNETSESETDSYAVGTGRRTSYYYRYERTQSLSRIQAMEKDQRILKQHELPNQNGRYYINDDESRSASPVPEPKPATNYSPKSLPTSNFTPKPKPVSNNTQIPAPMNKSQSLTRLDNVVDSNEATRPAAAAPRDVQPRLPRTTPPKRAGGQQKSPGSPSKGKIQMMKMPICRQQ